MPARSRASKTVVNTVESEEITEEDEVLAELEDEDEDYVADEDADEPDSDPDSKVRLMLALGSLGAAFHRSGNSPLSPDCAGTHKGRTMHC